MLNYKLCFALAVYVWAKHYIPPRVFKTVSDEKLDSCWQVYGYQLLLLGSLDGLLISDYLQLFESSTNKAGVKLSSHPNAFKESVKPSLTAFSSTEVCHVLSRTEIFTVDCVHTQTALKFRPECTLHGTHGPSIVKSSLTFLENVFQNNLPTLCLE